MAVRSSASPFLSFPARLKKWFNINDSVLVLGWQALCVCVCSSIIYPLSRLPAGQFLPPSRSSSLPSAGGVLWSAVGGNHSSSFLWSEVAELDVSFYRTWSRARPASEAPRAPMNTLTRPRSDATSSLDDEADTAGSRPIRAASSDADWKSHIVKFYGNCFSLETRVALVFKIQL